MERAEEVIEPRGHSSQEPSIIDIDDDEETYPTHAKKSQKRFKAKPTVIQSSDDPTDDSDLEKENKSNLDSDTEGNIKPEEDSEEELGKHLYWQKKNSHLPIYLEEWMVKDWTLPIYVFFQARPVIGVVAGCQCHKFQCATQLCKGKGAQARVV